MIRPVLTKTCLFLLMLIPLANAHCQTPNAEEASASLIDLLDLGAANGPSDEDKQVGVADSESEDPAGASQGVEPSEQPLEPTSELPPPDPRSDSKSVRSESAETTVEGTEPMQPVRELTGQPVLRGTIHEAFAQPMQDAPAATEVITREPPALVEEIPPTIDDTRKNMEWIPGYWSWDPEAEDFIWVSGVWRKKPKDRVWVAGRWEQVEGGHQWVPGVWLPTEDPQVVVEKQVLPTPPKSLEQGPTSPAPSEQHFWIPGIWNRTPDATYAWRPGYWARAQKNWVWVPDQYVWDPAGCVFVPGYWDYTWERRGTLYAPCTFSNFNARERVCYRPTQVIDTDQWLLNLWVGPRSRSYYFGDYYDLTTVGYTPWYQYCGNRRGIYDPFYSYYRWQFPTTYGIGLYGYLNQLYGYYGTHAALRPGVRLSPYRQFGTRGYVSLFGDVVRLNRLVGPDLARNRYGYRRDYLDDYFYRRGRGFEDYRGYRRGDDYRSGYRGNVRRDNDNTRSRRDNAANDRGGNRDQRNRAAVDSLGPVRMTPGLQRNPNQAVRGGSGRSGGPGPRQSLGAPRDGTNRPAVRGPLGPNRTSQSGDIDSQERGRGTSNRNSNNTERFDSPRVNRSDREQRTPPRANGAVRTNSEPGRGAVRQSTPGFSISGMKNARGRAEVDQQRAAMQRYIEQRDRRTSVSPRNSANPSSARRSTSVSPSRSPINTPRSPILRTPGTVSQAPQATRSSIRPPSSAARPRSTPSPARTSAPRATSSQSVAPRPTANRPSPRPALRSSAPSRPAAPVRKAQPSRPSQSFSISGMKNARSRAEVQRQRAAMQNTIRQRKGR